jgi:hypothetical protein
VPALEARGARAGVARFGVFVGVETERLQLEPAGIEVPEPAFHDRVPHGVIAKELRHDAHPQPACRAPRRERRRVARLPRRHQPRTQPSVALQQFAVVLFLVGEPERLGDADRLPALVGARAVEPVLQRVELGCKAGAQPGKAVARIRMAVHLAAAQNGEGRIFRVYAG